MISESNMQGRENVLVIHQESTSFKRGVTKSMYITLVDPSLHQDWDRYNFLPSIGRFSNQVINLHFAGHVTVLQ